MNELVYNNAEVVESLRSLGIKRQHPDSIYGLRATRNIVDLLEDTKDGSYSQEKLREIINPSPVPIRADELVFPFMVTESKTMDSGCDWYAIDIQTAFPIKAFLDAQDRLNQEVSKHVSQPLVWFFSHQSEEWRLAVAYTKEGPKRPRTKGIKDYVSSPGSEWWRLR